MATVLEPDCLYFTIDDYDKTKCSPQLRQKYYMLDDWMILLTKGLHNRLVYHPNPPPRSTIQPVALNPDLNFNLIEESYLGGEVVVIDRFLSEDGLRNLRNLALESTTFYDGKLGYLGSYVDDGLTSSWLDNLSRELQERLPRVLGNMPLRQAWMYKYDSDNEQVSEA